MNDYFEEQNLVNLNHILCDEQEKGGAMTNREKYMKEICDVALSGERVAVNRETLVPCKCGAVSCKKCIANTANGLCDYNLIDKWANSEYVEPRPFKKDELVEVSDDGIDWKLRYFSHQEDGLFYCYDGGYTSQEKNMAIPWAYYQKYGTLGGLINSDGSPTGYISEEGEGYVR